MAAFITAQFPATGTGATFTDVNVKLRSMASILRVAPVLVSAACGASPATRPNAETLPERRPAFSSDALRGMVADSAGRPLAGAFVTAQGSGGVAVSVLTDVRGRYEMPALRAARYRVEAHRPGFRPEARDSVSPREPATPLDFTLLPEAAPLAPPNSSARLQRLPEGETKRRFILDCTGCHQFGTAVVEVGGRPRARDEWQAAVEKMLSFAGAETGFPIISPERDALETADWLARALAVERDAPDAAGTAAGGAARTAASAAGPAAADAGTADEVARAVFTEYDLPHADDLPHDLMLDRGGQVIVTGMFQHVMYRLDPVAGTFDEIPIPVPQANPRALEIDPEGVWWVLLGGPEKIARFDPADGSWKTYDIGLYPHSIARDAAGGIWFNGHFTKDPIRIGRLEPASGEVRSYDLPPNAETAGSPIPYEIRAAPDGSLWGSELVGNRIFRFDIRTGQATFFVLPSPHSGPRRLDVAPDGTVWIPAYATGSLVRFDPETERFTEHPLPTPDALPYVARVERGSGAVWVAEAGADAIARFEPRSGRWTEFPLPTGSALIRHLDIDPETGAVWAAYANAPPVTPKIVRLELRPR